MQKSKQFYIFLPCIFYTSPNNKPFDKIPKTCLNQTANITNHRDWLRWIHFYWLNTNFSGFFYHQQTTKFSAPWKAYVAKEAMSKALTPSIEISMNIPQSVYQWKLIETKIILCYTIYLLLSGQISDILR